MRDPDAPAEEAFLARLAQAEAEVQADLALESIIAHRSEAERALLVRLAAYRTLVPVEGIIKLALDLPRAGTVARGPAGRVLGRAARSPGPPHP